jgi:hypothetical protein
MEKLIGSLSEVGRLQGKEVDVIRVGSTTLRKARCMQQIFEHLHPGREVTLYLYRHLFYKPVILGVKYTDTGEKTLLTPGVVRDSLIQIVVLLGLGFIFGTLMVGGLIVGLLGGNPESFGGVLALIGLGIALWLAVRFRLDYQAAKAD